MSTDLIRTGEQLDVMTLGQVLASSGYFQDTKDAAQAVVKVLAGYELGIGPIAAMTGIYIVNGRVAIGANLMAAAVKRSGKYDYVVRELSDKACSIAFLQDGREIGVSNFTLEDARKAQTKNLDRFPRNMLFARALSNGVRWYCPDVFSATVYTPDELRGDADAEPVVVSSHANVDTKTGEVHDTTIPIARVREQLRQIAQATGDPCAPEAAKDFTRLSLRQLDEFSTDLARILDEAKAGTLTLEWAEAQDRHHATRWKTQTAGSLARRLGAAADLAGAPAQPS